jgi:UDP-2,3-diacylglucosamine pyrophosphatase LpxH
MAILGDSWKSDGSHELLTIQLGDFFDMWMEFPGIAKSEELEKLKDAHNEFRDILYRGQFRGKPCLKATMILGNHDTKNGKPLEEIQFDLKGFNRTEDGRPFLFVTHGDAFDIIETFLPDSIEEFAVYFLGDLTPINNYSVGIRNEVWNKHMDHTGEINKPLGELESAITEPQHLLQTVKGSPRVTPEQPLPSLFCKQIIFPEQAEHRLFKRIYESFERTAEKDLPGQHVRIAAIGHTHRASMILCRPEDGRKPLLLMDVGAWIENCRYPLSENSEIVTEPSAQLGVIHGNDVRIYQIRLIENI